MDKGPFYQTNQLRDCTALAEALLHCNVKSSLDSNINVIQTPKFFSDDTTLSLELVIDPPSFI